MLYIKDVHMVLCGCPCHSQRRFYTAGRWNPFHSTVHTVPVLPGCVHLACLQPGNQGQGLGYDRLGTGSWKHR